MAERSDPSVILFPEVPVTMSTNGRPIALKPILDAIPEGMMQLPQWVVWKYVRKQGDCPKCDGRGCRKCGSSGWNWTKVPKNPRSGGIAKVNDPSTWGTFDDVLSRVDRMDGPGFVFTEADGFVGIDLDACRDGACAIEDWALQILEDIDSYAELSVSGTGIHVICRGRIPAGRKNERIEVYDRKRFFCTTGHVVRNVPIQDRDEQLTALWQRCFGKSQNGQVHQGKTGSTGGIPADDQLLIDKAMSFRNGGKFRALWEGNADGYKTESEADLALADMLAFVCGPDPNQIERLFSLSALGNRQKWQDRADYRIRTIAKALDGRTNFYRPRSSKRSKAHKPINAQHKPDLPRIDAGKKDLSKVTPEAWDALVKANDPPRLFVSGGLPVRMESDEDGHPVLNPLDCDRLRHELARAAVWFTTDAEGRQFEASPPVPICKDVLATPEPPLPPLRRITFAPTFAPNATLETAPGYHHSSGNILVTDAGCEIPTVKDQPSQKDVHDAVEMIHEVLWDFPFVDQAEKANALGLMIFPAVRDLIRGPTPLHLVEAPTPASGKGLLAQSLLHPFIGDHFGVIAQARDDDEWRKRITTVLMRRSPVVMIDNITRLLNSGTLAAALTATYWDDRILGGNELFRGPVRCIWVATANNPTISTEIARRCVRIRLDPKQDRPWLRAGFRHPDLMSWIRESRGKLIWAVLSLCQAWIVVGRPKGETKIGSYEDWAQTIGGILQVAGVRGFLGNLQEFYERADSEGAAWRRFVPEWWAKHQDTPVTSSELHLIAKEIEGFHLGKSDDERSQKTVLGKAIGAKRDCVVGDYRIVLFDTKQRAALWRLQACEGCEGK